MHTFPVGQILPHAAIYASDGNYYGVSYLNDGSGHVFRLTPAGTLSVLLNFPAGTFVGNSEFAPILQASDGNLYGVTPNGGANGTGTIYKLTLGGQYTCNGIIRGTAQAGGPTGAGAVFALDGLPKPAPQSLEFGPQHGPVGTRVTHLGQQHA